MRAAEPVGEIARRQYREKVHPHCVEPCVVVQSREKARRHGRKLARQPEGERWRGRERAREGECPLRRQLRTLH